MLCDDPFRSFFVHTTPSLLLYTKTTPPAVGPKKTLHKPNRNPASPYGLQTRVSPTHTHTRWNRNPCKTTIRRVSWNMMKNQSHGTTLQIQRKNIEDYYPVQKHDPDVPNTEIVQTATAVLIAKISGNFVLVSGSQLSRVLCTIDNLQVRLHPHVV